MLEGIRALASDFFKASQKDRFSTQGKWPQVVPFLLDRAEADSTWASGTLRLQLRCLGRHNGRHGGI